MIILIRKGEPIVLEESDTIDWCKVYRYVMDLSADHDEWRSKSTLNGLTISEFCKQYEIVKWRWNIIGQQFYKQD